MPQAPRRWFLALSITLTLVLSTIALAAPRGSSGAAAQTTANRAPAQVEPVTAQVVPTATAAESLAAQAQPAAVITTAGEAAELTNTQPLPATLLPPPADLQIGEQWVLPALTDDEWLVLERPNRPLVVGYYAEDWEGDLRALNSLRLAASRLDRAVNFQIQLQGDGSLVTRDYPGLMDEAKQRGIPVYGLLHNWDESQFSAGVARSVLGSATARTRVVENLIEIARAQGLAGIDVDLENLPGDLRESYTALVRELAGRLKSLGLGLTVSVPAKNWDDTTSNWGGAFDYRALGQLADQVAIMTYDQHTPGLPAGPVASVGWVEGVMAYATSQIPPQKILLGIAAYGYDWIVGTTEARGLSVSGALGLASSRGLSIQWDDSAQVPYFTYSENGTNRIVYFENSYSAAPKIDLVRRYGLGGIAIWRLGLEEERLWSVVDSKLR